MSLPRSVSTFRVKGSFGSKVVGVAAGICRVENVDEFLAKFAEVDKAENTVTQVFDASRVAGAGHLIQAARLALNAQASKMGFASSPSIELICWAAAERQIGRAFEKIGVRSGEIGLAFVSVGNSSSHVRRALSKIFRKLVKDWDNSLIEISRNKIPGLRRVFSISKEELAIASIEKIVLDRVALLAVAK